MVDPQSSEWRKLRTHNRGAWDSQVESGNPWTVPVTKSEIAEARQGRWQILLTPCKPVPRAWFPDLRECDVLCLASGGGQQGPTLAAAGAKVTVLDNSPRQLAQDRLVAERESLAIATIEGDMADLHMFQDESFDLVVHPVSNVFVPQVQPVWAEAYRVLRSGGVLLGGFTNPMRYLFDLELEERAAILQVKHRLPYSDLDSLSEEEKQRYLRDGEPFEFSHTLEDQIGGQLEVGFVLTGFYEDRHDDGTDDLLSRYTDS
ncbi:MAG TPA: class I SAM-dependent methyltransferase, partial [Anaerolineae bacterium]|nr:class I SAM-dependent methyltransferase [Anaerolineae bacterium]